MSKQSVRLRASPSTRLMKEMRGGVVEKALTTHSGVDIVWRCFHVQATAFFRVI